jgi:hypothetical protein
MDCLRRGRVQVGNPFRPGKKKVVSLKKDAVDAFVFWTRNPRPLMEHLGEIDRGGYPYYFLITLTGYSRLLEPGVPAVGAAADFFEKLAARIGRKRIIWRYDPVIFSAQTDSRFHEANFSKLAELLAPFSCRVIVSFFDCYAKAGKRLKQAGIAAQAATGTPELRANLLGFLATIARRFDLEIQSCAEEASTAAAVAPGKCIDEKLLNGLFGLNLEYRKDPSQRKLCLCQQSLDIGSYGACGHGCLYCYAC